MYIYHADNRSHARYSVRFLSLGTPVQTMNHTQRIILKRSNDIKRPWTIIWNRLNLYGDNTGMMVRVLLCHDYKE